MFKETRYDEYMPSMIITLIVLKHAFPDESRVFISIASKSCEVSVVVTMGISVSSMQLDYGPPYRRY